MADVSKIVAGSRVRVTTDGTFRQGNFVPDSGDFALYSNVLSSDDVTIEVLSEPVPEIRPGDFITSKFSTVQKPGWVGLVTKSGYVSLVGHNKGEHETFRFTDDYKRRYKVVTANEAFKIIAAREGTEDVEF